MPSPTTKPTSIWPGPGLETYLAFAGPRTRREGVSRMLDQVCSRYAYVVKASIPEWSLDDWMTTLDALKDHDMGSIPSIRALGVVVQAAIEHNKLGSSSTSTNFAYQAKRLSPAGLVAVAEVIEGFRRRQAAEPAPGDRDAFEVWLREVGASGFEAPKG